MATSNEARIVLSATDRTRGAFESAQRNLKGLLDTAGSLPARLAPITAAVAGIGSALSALSVKGTIDLADQLGKLSQRSGVAVEDLSALRYAGALADVSLEDLGDSFKKLNQNIAAAARGEQAQAEAFRAIGVSVVDATGKVRSADKVFEDIADAFASYEDGANKVALATALGGRSFEALIPLLNGGRRGLQDARAELERFGGVIGGDVSDAAQEFNDNITKLGFALEALKVRALGPVVDQLAELSAKYVESARNGSLLLDVFRDLSVISNPGAAFIKFAGAKLGFDQSEVDKLRTQAKGIEDSINLVNEALARNPGNPAATRQLEFLRQQLAAVNAQADKLASGVRTLPDTGAGGGRGFVNPKVEAPALRSGDAGKQAGTKAVDDALAARRAVLEANIKAIQSGLERERDLYRFHEQYVSGIYRDGLISLGDYYDARNERRQRNLEETRRAIDAEVALLQQERDTLVKTRAKPSDVQQVDTRIQEAQARRSRAEQQAAQDAVLAQQEQARAVADLQARLGDLDQQLAELSGNNAGAALLEIARQVRAAEQLLRDTGQDTGRADQLRALLVAQQQFAQAREDFAVISDRAAVAEERLRIAQQNGGTGLLESERQVMELRRGELAQIDALIERTAALSEATRDPRILDYLEQLRLARERAAQQVDPTKLRFDALGADIGSTLAQGVGQAIADPKNWRDVLNNVGARISAAVTEQVIVAPLQQAITGLINGNGPNFLQRLFTGAQPAPGQPQQQGDGVLGAITQLLGITTAAQATDAAGTAAQTAAITGAQAAGTASLVSSQAAGTAAIVSAIGASSAAIVAAISAKGAADTAAGLLDGGGGLDSLFDIGSALFFHSGGVVGQGGTLGAVPPGVFERARRYHSGGLAGDEVPAILQRGEEVLTRADPRHVLNGGAQPQRVVQQALHYHAAPGESAATKAQSMRRFAREAAMESQRGTAG